MNGWMSGCLSGMIRPFLMAPAWRVSNGTWGTPPGYAQGLASPALARSLRPRSAPLLGPVLGIIATSTLAIQFVLPGFIVLPLGDQFPLARVEVGFKCFQCFLPLGERLSLFAQFLQA